RTGAAQTLLRTGSLQPGGPRLAGLARAVSDAVASGSGSRLDWSRSDRESARRRPGRCVSSSARDDGGEEAAAPVAVPAIRVEAGGVAERTAGHVLNAVRREPALDELRPDDPPEIDPASPVEGAGPRAGALGRWPPRKRRVARTRCLGQPGRDVVS